MNNILIACEESQRVCSEFRNLGYNAFSCDLMKCSGGHPEWHILGDALKIINGNTTFTTMDGICHFIDGKWDLLIAHPPCTFLAGSGNRWFNEERYGSYAIQRKKDRDDAIDFFMKFVEADCDRIAIENPIGIMSSIYRKPDQIIQPYLFGDPARKATCLWLKGLPLLYPTKFVDPILVHYNNGKSCSPWLSDTWKLPADVRRCIRSKTFPGIAHAMAFQWSESSYII